MLVTCSHRSFIFIQCGVWLVPVSLCAPLTLCTMQPSPAQPSLNQIKSINQSITTTAQLNKHTTNSVCGGAALWIGPCVAHPTVLWSVGKHTCTYVNIGFVGICLFLVCCFFFFFSLVFLFIYLFIYTLDHIHTYM